ncbi:MAG: glucose-1-phosphate adenylyltransferase [Anaerolineales bacterium]|nr:glucose-1-phosphate adenylyltransferase [Anaerolineales bacterium]
MPTTNDILAIILGGGRGSRLFPLTKLRSKPAVPIAGKYRLIDIPISNCINSNIYRIAVLTQYNSVSLTRHVNYSYRFDTFHPGWVQILAAEQTPESADWYQGTADAVRKQVFEIKSARQEYTLVLGGDHLYRMDYSELAQFHWENEADITVAVQPIPEKDVSRFGILKQERDGHISDFVEKPKDPDVLKKFTSRKGSDTPYLGSMGLYMFRTDVLIKLLSEYPSFDDFGGDVIPHAIKTHKVFGFGFEGYWRDIGTIRAFYETNLELTQEDPPYDIYDPKAPIYTRARYLPGSIIMNSKVKDVLMGEGCRIRGAEIERSVVGLRSQIEDGVRIKDSILMGADYYSIDNHLNQNPIGIGSNCYIEGAILDKNARVGENVVIRPFPRGADLDNETWFVRDGIVIIPKNTEICPGTRITPEDV